METRGAGSNVVSIASESSGHQIEGRAKRGAGILCLFGFCTPGIANGLNDFILISLGTRLGISGMSKRGKLVSSIKGGVLGYNNQSRYSPSRTAKIMFPIFFVATMYA